METMDLLSFLGCAPEKKEEAKKPAAKKAATKKTETKKPVEKKEEKLVFPLTVLTGICQPVVLSKEQAGDADTMEKIADLICKQNGIPRHLTIAKKLSNDKIAVVLDRGKVQAKGEFDVTATTVVAIGTEKLSLAELEGSRTSKEINDFLNKQTGEFVPYQFIADKEQLYAMVGEAHLVGKVALPVSVKSPLGDMVLTAADFEVSEVDMSSVTSGEVEAGAIEEKVFLSATHKEVEPLLALFRPSEPQKENVLFVGEKLLTRDIPKGATPAKTLYPTDAVISMLFNRIQLSPDMFGGREKVEEKDIIAVLAKDYPEFTSARTRLTYDKEGNFIFPSLKSSSKGAELFSSRKECLAAAAKNPVYFLGNYIEGRTLVRCEKTPVSVTEASADGSVGRFQWKLPKIPKQILVAICQFFSYVAEDFEVEALVQIGFNPYEGEYFVRIPQQIVSKAAVTTEDIPMSTPEMYYVMDIHSHNTMPAFFSSIDNADEKANRVYGVVGGFGGVPEMKLRAATGGKFVSIALSDVFEENGDGQEYISAQALYDEWRCCSNIN